MRKALGLIVLVILASPRAGASPGHVTVLSQNDVEVTVRNLEAYAERYGMKILMKVDHGAPVKPGKTREGQLLLVDHPKFQNALLGASVTIGVDLPLKIFTYRDEKNQVWVTYPDPRTIAARHHMSDSKAAEEFSGVLSSLTLLAATKN